MTQGESKGHRSAGDEVARIFRYLSNQDPGQRGCANTHHI